MHTYIRACEHLSLDDNGGKVPSVIRVVHLTNSDVHLTNTYRPCFNILGNQIHLIAYYHKIFVFITLLMTSPMYNRAPYRNKNKIKINDFIRRQPLWSREQRGGLPFIRYSGAVYPYVPITAVVKWVLPSSGALASRARPKSESLALKSCQVVSA